jgi:SNF family Na+-dependent transporter
MLNKIYFALILITLPIFSYAQNLSKTRTLLENADDIVRTVLVPLAFTLALLFFFWGVAKYIWSAGDKEEGKKIMVWGVVALTVMTTIWGLVYFIGTELGLDEQGTITIPTIQKTQ